MKSNNLKPTERFGNRVKYYLKYRPHYPEEIVSFLSKEIHLNRESVIADIGSGTGFLSEIFLKNNNVVFGIEPNEEMRLAGEEYLKQYSTFKSINGTAEKTTLEDSCADVITVGQAFHWFDHDKCKKEFSRILRNNKFIVIVYNERSITASKFMAEYEELLRKFAADYGGSTNRYFPEDKIKSFLGSEKLYTGIFNNRQIFDLEGFIGRTLSSSYTPSEDDENYDDFLVNLKLLFSIHQKNNIVEMIYDTKAYWGTQI
jgi:SAM-dependent methyltransferase